MAIKALVDFIRFESQHGAEPAEFKATLKARGWKTEDIEAAELESKKPLSPEDSTDLASQPSASIVEALERALEAYKKFNKPEQKIKVEKSKQGETAEVMEAPAVAAAKVAEGEVISASVPEYPKELQLQQQVQTQPKAQTEPTQSQAPKRDEKFEAPKREKKNQKRLLAAAILLFLISGFEYTYVAGKFPFRPEVIQPAMSESEALSAKKPTVPATEDQASEKTLVHVQLPALPEQKTESPTMPEPNAPVKTNADYIAAAKSSLTVLLEKSKTYYQAHHSYTDFCRTQAITDAREALLDESRAIYSCHESSVGYLIHLQLRKNEKTQYCADSRGNFITMPVPPLGIVCHAQ
jgi:hypothetical protein